MGYAINLAPERILSLAALVAAFAIGGALWLATQQPSLGVSWRAADHAIAVDQVERPPAAGVLRPGQKVTGMLGPDGREYDLTPLELTPEPDMVFMQYSGMDAFYARQSQRHALFAQDSLRLQTSDGEVTLKPDASRPLGSLPPVFWFQLLCGVGGLLAGAGVWAYRRQDPATKYYALTGVAMLMFSVSAAIYSTRELTLNGTLFRTLSAINQSGALLFCGGLVAVLWYYPTQLARFSAGPWIVAAFLALSAAIWLRLHDSVELVAHMPVIVGYLSTYVLAAFQWRRTRSDPLQRAALRWFLLSWLFGSGAFVAFVMLPALMGYDSGAIQGYAFGFFLLIHVGVAVGVLRYQLFRLDRWWFVAWSTFFAGLAIIALDLLFVYVLGIDARFSLITTLALAGWLYFPLRQALWIRVSRWLRPEHPPALIQMVTQALTQSSSDEIIAWRALLQRVFQPLRMETIPAPSGDRISEQGLALDTVGEAGLPSLRLNYCEGGARLFKPADVAMLADLRHLFREILTYRNRLAEAVAAERDRVARDLHDDVGARLLTLAHRLDEPYAERVREALTELRSVVYSMQPRLMPLEDALGDWRAEVAERCDAAGVALDWRVTGDTPDHSIAGGPLLAATRVLREAVTNAIRHAQPEQLVVALALSPTRIECAVRHAYSGPPPAQWQESVGLGNLRERIARHGGRLEWRVSHGQLETRWFMPLDAPESGAEDGDAAHLFGGFPATAD